MKKQYLYRDANFSQDLVDKYIPGILYLECGFTDTTNLRGGLLGNVRYLVVSDQGSDFSAIDKNAMHWGLIIFRSDMVFKVLDVYHVGDTTQILISPDKDLEDESQEEVVAAARSDFDELRNAKPVAMLNTSEWMDRLKFPIGLDDDGRPFPVPI